MRELVMEVAVASVLLLIGLLAIARPELLQHWALHIDPARRFNPAKEYIASPAYLTHARIVGAVAVGIAMILGLSAYMRWIMPK
jgi:hypothetical protein